MCSLRVQVVLENPKSTIRFRFVMCVSCKSEDTRVWHYTTKSTSLPMKTNIRYTRHILLVGVKSKIVYTDWVQSVFEVVVGTAKRFAPIFTDQSVTEEHRYFAQIKNRSSLLKRYVYKNENPFSNSNNNYNKKSRP